MTDPNRLNNNTTKNIILQIVTRLMTTRIKIPKSLFFCETVKVILTCHRAGKVDSTLSWGKTNVRKFLRLPTSQTI